MSVKKANSRSGNISRNPKKPGVAALDNLEGICVAGITPFTTIDFPGRLAGVFYLQGCPWRCRYCCNSEFWPLPSVVSSENHSGSSVSPVGQLVSLDKILDFLNARKGHLDGIVFSGGEPTLHEHLPVWMRAVKGIGFQIGLHTAGACPAGLKEVLPLCDWVGMDIKGPFDLYEKITQIPNSGALAHESAKILLASKVSYEFRTTVHPDLLSEEEILRMVRELASLGSTRHVLQAFRPDHCPDKELRESGLRSLGISSNLRTTLKTVITDLDIRGSVGD